MNRFILTLLILFLAAGIVTPARGADNPLSPGLALGAGFGVQVKEWRAGPEDLDDIKDMGIQFLRFGFPWSTVESRKGVYDWSRADFFMRMIKDKGLYVIYEVGGFNGTYSPTVDALPDFTGARGEELPKAPVSPEALAAMERYIAETVRRYHGDHVIWEIWNEPDMNSDWPPEVNAREFTRVISLTCATIKRIDPRAIVIGPALAFFPAYDNNGHKDFLATILKSPAGACLDAISVHPYRRLDHPPETVMKDYDDLRTYIAANTLPGRKVLPIINSEWGYSLAEATPEQQAAYIIRSFVMNRLSGIPVSIWYEYRDSLKDDQTEIGKMEREAHFGIRDYGDDDKLSATVLKAILPHLQDAVVEKRVMLDGDKVYALMLKSTDGQRHSLLFWLADRVNKNPMALTIGDAGKKTDYPIGLIPTLVCTGPAPGVSIAAVPDRDEQEYYVPCSP